MVFEDSDSDDSLLKGRRLKAVKPPTNEYIQSMFKAQQKEEEGYADVRAWQKENKHLTDEALEQKAQKLISSTRKNRPSQKHDEIDTSDGYDGAFPRKDFEIMKEILEAECTPRQGNLPTICFTMNNEFFFPSKEKACFALKFGLEALKPCELGSLIPALIEKDLMKHFLRSHRFLKLAKSGENEMVVMVQSWLFKVACSAGCGDDLSDLGYAALHAVEQLGIPSLAVPNLGRLLSCWLAKSSEDSSSFDSKNISGLRNAIVLAAQSCAFDAASSHDLEQIMTQLLLLGLDAATETDFRAALNALFNAILTAVAQEQTTNYEAWCESYTKQLISKLRVAGGRDPWLALPAAIRLIETTWSSSIMIFRVCLSITVLLECTEIVGTENGSIEEWLKTDRAAYLSEVSGSSLHWKCLATANFALYQTLTCFDAIIEYQTRLRSIVEAIFLAYCCGNVVFVDQESTNEDLQLQERFLADFDQTTEKLQGGKTGKITSRHIMYADYLLSIIHSYNMTMKEQLEERQRVCRVKQSTLSSFFKPKA